MLEFNEYSKAQASDEVVEVPLKWLCDNIGRFVGKKEERPKWMTSFILELSGTKIITGDPEILQGIDEDKSKTLLDKGNSLLLKAMCDARLKNNVSNLPRSTD